MSGTSHGKTRALEDFRSHVAHRSQTINLWRVLPQPRLKAVAGLMLWRETHGETVLFMMRLLHVGRFWPTALPLSASTQTWTNTMRLRCLHTA
jgi:hypothetical protein